LKTILLCILSLTYISCSKSNQSDSRAPAGIDLKVSFSETLDQGEIEQATRGLKLLIQKDKALSKYITDIEYIDVGNSPVPKEHRIEDYRYEKYGWIEYYEVRVKIVDDPKAIPPKCQGAMNVLYYYISPTGNAGYEISKGWGLGDDCYFGNGENVFVPVPEMIDTTSSI
jgi:hypothetical protein